MQLRQQQYHTLPFALCMLTLLNLAAAGQGSPHVYARSYAFAPTCWCSTKCTATNADVNELPVMSACAGSEWASRYERQRAGGRPG